MRFLDRADAGERLAEAIAEEALLHPLILAIPRGGVPIVTLTAERLHCPWDVVVVRKLAFPWNPELGFGAVALDGTSVLNQELLRRAHLTPEEVEQVKVEALREVERRDGLYRAGRPFPFLGGCSVILTDDGLASGYTMLAAVEFVRKRRPLQVVVASPVASDSAMVLLQSAADRLIVLHVSDAWSFAVASHYHNFAQLTDEEVLTALKASQARASST
ncbi:MAG: phosphoribosyltransferase [Candidatus Methylomirabilales bacterium]